MGAPVRLIGAFDPQGREGLLDRAWDRLDAACGVGSTGPEVGPREPAFRVLRLGLRTRGGAATLRRPRGLVAAGVARLYGPASTGPDPEAEDLDRLADAWRGGAFDRLRIGPAAIEGDYSVAICDPEAPALILLRDAFGHEPLAYARTPEGLVLFSSHVHAIRPPEPDAEALACWLDHRILPPGRTVWPGVSEAPAGHLVRFDETGVEVRRHWRAGPDASAAGLSEADAVDLGRERAREAVLSRWGRVGAAPAVMFSGGLDSSLIAGLACEAAGGEEVAAFASTSARDAVPAERRAREAMAARWPNLRIREVTSQGIGLLDHAGAAWERFAQPELDYLGATHYALPEAMRREGRDSLLGGFGGDMCVSSPLVSLLFHRLVRLDLAGAALEARAMRRRGLGRKGIAAAAIRPLRQVFGLPAQRSAAVARIGPARRPPSGLPETELRLTGPLNEQRSGLEAVLCWTIADFHLGDAAMAYGQPLLDTRLISAAMAAPLGLQRAEGLPRGYIRRLLTATAPPEVAFRPDKSPFQPDFDEMVRAALPKLRADLRTFRDLPLWRDLVDEPLLETRLATLEREPALRRLPELNGATSAWHLGDFLRRL